MEITDVCITGCKSVCALVEPETRGGREISSLQMADFSEMTFELTFEKQIGAEKPMRMGIDGGVVVCFPLSALSFPPQY